MAVANCRDLPTASLLVCFYDHWFPSLSSRPCRRRPPPLTVVLPRLASDENMTPSVTGLCIDDTTTYIAWTQGLHHRLFLDFICEANLFIFI